MSICLYKSLKKGDFECFGIQMFKPILFLISIFPVKTQHYPHKGPFCTAIITLEKASSLDNKILDF